MTFFSSRWVPGTGFAGPCEMDFVHLGAARA